MRLKSIKGVMLFEVLLAVLVLAIGITGSLRAFSGIVQVTKRSRDLFEANFVTSDLYFRMFALPEDLTTMATGIKKKYHNETLELQSEYSYKSEMTKVLLPEPEDETAPMSDLSGVIREKLLSFARNKTVISNESGVLYSLETFHAIPEED